MSDEPRIVMTPSDAHVVVRVGGQTIADSHRPVVLEERGHPTRYYLHPDDVRTDWLRPSDRHSRCPYKGQASYWSLEVDGRTIDDVVWSYQDPIDDAVPIAGLLCFYNDRVEITVDGSPLT